MTTTNTTGATLPPSMEVAGGIVAEQCYMDRELHQKILDDPMEAISNILSEHIEKPVDLKEMLPNCKVHSLQNTRDRWHIVLPFEYHGEEPSRESGILSEEDMEQVVGGIFGLVSATAAVLGITASGISVIASAGTGLAATTAAYAATFVASGIYTSVMVNATFLASGVVAGVIASLVGTGVAAAAGVSIAAIAGLDAASIIDVW